MKSKMENKRKHTPECLERCLLSWLHECIYFIVTKLAGLHTIPKHYYFLPFPPSLPSYHLFWFLKVNVNSSVKRLGSRQHCLNTSFAILVTCFLAWVLFPITGNDISFRAHHSSFPSQHSPTQFYFHLWYTTRSLWYFIRLILLLDCFTEHVSVLIFTLLYLLSAFR